MLVPRFKDYQESFTKFTSLPNQIYDEHMKVDKYKYDIGVLELKGER